MDADTNYSFNPWMNPVVRPGDNVDPSVLLDPAETIYAVANQVPMPAPAGYTPRLGYPTGEPTIMDVLDAQSFVAARDTATSQDTGMQGTLRPAQSDW